MDSERLVGQKWRLLKATLNERARRLWAGAEADAIGHGGVAAVARATGLAISTVRKGRDEARAGARREDVVNVRRSAKYLRRPGLARLAFVATRQPPSPPAVEAAREIYRSDGKLFIFLTDKDLLDLAELGGHPVDAEAYLRRHYQRQKMSL